MSRGSLLVTLKVGNAVEVYGPARIVAVRDKGGQVQVAIQAEKSVRIGSIEKEQEVRNDTQDS